MPVTHNLFSSLGAIAGVDVPGWTTNGSAGSGRVSETITTTIGTHTYTRSDAALDVGAGEAWQLEAIVSASPLGTAGERGARLWIRFFDANAPAIPPNFDQHRLVELRLIEDTGGTRRLVLFDGANDTPKASLTLDWSQAGASAYRVRIKRQWDGFDSWIWLQAEPSSSYDDPAAPNVVSPTSQRILLSSFSVTSGAGTTYGFGNAVAGNYSSSWASVLLTRCDDDATVLPYWPEVPPAPDTLSHIDGGLDAPQGVYFQADLSTQGYLDTDVASLFLNADGGDIAGPAITNPSAAPGVHTHDFTGLSDDQNALTNAKYPAVSGWLTVADAAGRTRTGSPATTTIPDKTRPVVVIRIEQKDNVGVFDTPLTAYNVDDQPLQIAVEVTERHLDAGASSLTVNGDTTLLSALSSTSLGAYQTRFRWPVSAIPGGLREWDNADPVGSLNQISVSVKDDATNEGTAAHAFELNTAAPVGTIVMSTNTGVPALTDFVAIPAAPGNQFKVPLFVGIRLTTAQIADLYWGDGFQVGPFPSLMTLDGTSHPLDVAAGFNYVTDGVDHVIYWSTALGEGSHDVAFELHDGVGNVGVIPSEAVVVDLTAPSATIEIDAGSGWGAAAGPYGSVPVRVSVTTGEASPKDTSYIEIQEGANPPTKKFFNTDLALVGGRWLFTPDPAITTDGAWTVRTEVIDPANNSSGVVTASFSVGLKPSFYIAGYAGNNADAVRVSHTHDDNTNLDPSGLLLLGPTQNNYVGVRVSNAAGALAGPCKYRQFTIPACLFTGTGEWRLIHQSGAAPEVASIAPGATGDSVGNTNFNQAHPEFPQTTDPVWVDHANGDMLHTCTAVVLHSPDDPLMLPGPGGTLVPIDDAWFETTGGGAGSFEVEIMGRIDGYTGSTGGYWNAVFNNPKIANRNINIQNVGV